MTATALGLEFAQDPNWFYGLDRAAQIRVLAFDRIRRGTGQAKRNKLKGQKLKSTVKATPEALAWLEG
jgi:hypothetical protein